MSQLEKLKNATSLHDVAHILGFKPKSLSYILYVSPVNKYKKFQIPKRSGVKRFGKVKITKNEFPPLHGEKIPESGRYLLSSLPSYFILISFYFYLTSISLTLFFKSRIRASSSLCFFRSVFCWVLVRRILASSARIASRFEASVLCFCQSS